MILMTHFCWEKYNTHIHMYGDTWLNGDYRGLLLFNFFHYIHSTIDIWSPNRYYETFWGKKNKTYKSLWPHRAEGLTEKKGQLKKQFFIFSRLTFKSLVKTHHLLSLPPPTKKIWIALKWQNDLVKWHLHSI